MEDDKFFRQRAETAKVKMKGEERGRNREIEC